MILKIDFYVEVPDTYKHDINLLKRGLTVDLADSISQSLKSNRNTKYLLDEIWNPNPYQKPDQRYRLMISDMREVGIKVLTQDQVLERMRSSKS